MKKSLFVGQTVWITRRSYRGKCSVEPIEAVIEKVGNKYFSVDYPPKTKFSIETMNEVSDFSLGGKCYLSLQELLDKIEADKLTQKIQTFFSNHTRPIKSLETLQKIYALITL